VEEDQPLASLKAAFARMPAAYAFPDDAEFRAALTEGDLYHKRVCKHLLDGLENRDLKEQSDTSGYSIEHIMPQNEKMPKAWRDMLGEDWREVQRTWLHRLGNLTLTGYNSTYSDRPFEEKKAVQNGFRQSSVRLNEDVREAAHWTPAEMSARGARLAARALTVWPRLDADTATIREMELSELRARAAGRDVGRVDMTETARALFEALRTRMRAAFPEMVEMAETKSVSYHDPDFFLEALPRKRRLVLLVAIEHNEVESPDDRVEDMNDRNFVANAAYSGGVLVKVGAEEDLDLAMRVITQARTLMAGT
jgi:predicted transport protein